MPHLYDDAPSQRCVLFASKQHEASVSETESSVGKGQEVEQRGVHRLPPKPCIQRTSGKQRNKTSYLRTYFPSEHSVKRALVSIDVHRGSI